jgi:trk system potassium uptake protein TrkA
MTGTDAEVLEYRVPEGSKIVKGKIRDINFPKGAIVGGGTRDGKPFIATGDTEIKANDKVVVFTLPQAFEKMSKFFL